MDIHNSTKHKHIHFIVNRVNTHGINTIEAQKVGERFGKAVREVCREMNLKTDVEIGIEKKLQMLKDLQQSLKTAKSFDELTAKMKILGYQITWSQNQKVGISGMRLVRFSDINTSTQRLYQVGYKLSEITNKLKIKDIKEILQQNSERFHSENTEYQSFDKSEKQQNKNSLSEEIQSAVKQVFKPTYVVSDDELIKGKAKKRKNEDKTFNNLKH